MTFTLGCSLQGTLRIIRSISVDMNPVQLRPPTYNLGNIRARLINTTINVQWGTAVAHSVLTELIGLISDFRSSDNNSEPNSVHVKRCESDVNKYHHSVSRNNKSAIVRVWPEQWSRNVGIWSAQNVMYSEHQQFDMFLLYNYSSSLTTKPMGNPLFKQFVLLQNTAQTPVNATVWQLRADRELSDLTGWLDLGLKLLFKLITPSFCN